MLGDNDLQLFTKEVGQSYNQIDLDTFGELPGIDMSIKWPAGSKIPLTTPPKGRNKKSKKPQFSPNSSMENTSKRGRLDADSSIEKDGDTDTVETEDSDSEIAGIFTKVTGRRMNSKKYTKADFMKKTKKN